MTTTRKAVLIGLTPVLLVLNVVTFALMLVIGLYVSVDAGLLIGGAL